MAKVDFARGFRTGGEALTDQETSGSSRAQANLALFAKDKVELRLWRAVCVDKNMTLNQGAQLYLRGWTKLLPRN